MTFHGSSQVILTIPLIGTSGGEKPYEYAPVVIEDNCYIGPNSVIQEVTIKKGTIIWSQQLC